ncbi:MAG: NUDIX domain-containing protein [Nocardioides sp.]
MSRARLLIAMHFTEYDTRIAAYAVIVEDDRMLVIWWNGEGLREPGWSLPGGGVEFAETLEDAVHREVREETGLDIDLGPILATHVFTRPAASPETRAFRWLRVLYAARVTGGTLGTLEVGGSTDFATWMPIEELRTAPARRELIEHGLAAWRQMSAR